MDFRNMLKRNDSSVFSNFFPISLGNGISMSIQAGRTHYCSPRAQLADPFEYDSFEVAFVKEGVGFVDPIQNQDLADFSYDQVLGYVDVERVQELYEVALKNSSDEDFADCLKEKRIGSEDSSVFE